MFVVSALSIGVSVRKGSETYPRLIHIFHGKCKEAREWMLSISFAAYLACFYPQRVPNRPTTSKTVPVEYFNPYVYEMEQIIRLNDTCTGSPSQYTNLSTRNDHPINFMVDLGREDICIYCICY